MVIRAVFLTSLILSGFAAGLSAQQQPVLIQLSALSPTEQAAAMAAIRELEELLSDWRLGCGGIPVKYGWSQYQLARFVAGRLTGLGYPSQLARAGESWWVLSQVKAGDRGFWVPVVPGLADPSTQKCYQPGVFLGYIPWAGTGEFEAQYLSPEEIAPLPPNRPPSGTIRVVPSSPEPGERARFLGTGVVDPDGMIISLVWDFGDGSTSKDPNPAHVYEKEGTYTVTLTLIDDAGAQVVLERSVRVREVPKTGGCGCGG